MNCCSQMKLRVIELLFVRSSAVLALLCLTACSVSGTDTTSVDPTRRPIGPELREGDVHYGLSWSLVSESNYSTVLRGADSGRPRFVMHYEHWFSKGTESAEVLRTRAQKQLLAQIRYPLAPRRDIDDDWSDEELLEAMRVGRMKKKDATDSYVLMSCRVQLRLGDKR